MATKRKSAAKKGTAEIKADVKKAMKAEVDKVEQLHQQLKLSIRELKRQARLGTFFKPAGN